MKLGSVSENLSFEKRISITPEIVKKYISLGFEICLNSNYGSHLGFFDEEYRNCGAEIATDKKDILDKFRQRINKNFDEEFAEAKIQVRKIGELRLNQILYK